VPVARHISLSQHLISPFWPLGCLIIKNIIGSLAATRTVKIANQINRTITFMLLALRPDKSLGYEVSFHSELQIQRGWRSVWLSRSTLAFSMLAIFLGEFCWPASSENVEGRRHKLSPCVGDQKINWAEYERAAIHSQIPNDVHDQHWRLLTMEGNSRIWRLILNQVW